MTVDDPDKLPNEIHQVVATEVAKALAGVELWEARADAAKITPLDGNSQLDHLTLHAKGILIDRQRSVTHTGYCLPGQDG